jgi:hypothetical protein
MFALSRRAFPLEIHPDKSRNGQRILFLENLQVCAPLIQAEMFNRAKASAATLKPLEEAVQKLGRSMLEEQSVNSGDAHASASRMASLLVSMQSYDMASRIAKVYKLN